MKKRIIIPIVIVSLIAVFFVFIFPLFVSEKSVRATVCIYLQDAERGEYVYVKKANCNISEDKKYYKPATKYNFEIDSEKSVLTTETLENVTFKVYYKCKIFKVTFSGDGGELVSGSEELNLRAGQKIVKPVYKKEGFTLIGFKNKLKGDQITEGAGESEDASASEEITISNDLVVMEDCEFVAVWAVTAEE